MKFREIDERLKALQRETAVLDRRDNELLAEKKKLSELKGKKRQLEQKISTKQDRSASPNSLKNLDFCLGNSKTHKLLCVFVYFHSVQFKADGTEHH